MAYSTISTITIEVANEEFLTFTKGKEINGDKISVKFKSQHFIYDNEIQRFMGNISIDDAKELIRVLQFMTGDA